MSCRILVFALLLAACGNDPAPQPEPPRKSAQKTASAPPEVAIPRSSRPADGQDAAETLKLYYSHLETGDYGSAWAMRLQDEAGRDRFVANFKAYESYRATVGTPSEPVESEGWAYVEVPVMIYGRYRGGRSFGSSGSVSMRRATTAAASGAERQWHIYTGD